MAVATLYPLGFYLLVRAYEMGDGRYPQPVLGVVLSWLGVLVALGVAIRSQSATTRREYLGEVIPGIGGFALMAIGAGHPGRPRRRPRHAGLRRRAGGVPAAAARPRRDLPRS